MTCTTALHLAFCKTAADMFTAAAGPSGSQGMTPMAAAPPTVATAGPAAASSVDPKTPNTPGPAPSPNPVPPVAAAAWAQQPGTIAQNMKPSPAAQQLAAPSAMLPIDRLATQALGWDKGPQQPASPASPQAPAPPQTAAPVAQPQAPAAQPQAPVSVAPPPAKAPVAPPPPQAGPSANSLKYRARTAEVTAPTVVPQATESYQPLRAAALKAQRDQWRAQNPGQTNYRMIDDGAAEEAKWGRVPAGFKGDPNGGLRFKSQGLSAARVQAQPARKPRMSFGRPGR